MPHPQDMNGIANDFVQHAITRGSAEAAEKLTHGSLESRRLGS